MVSISFAMPPIRWDASARFSARRAAWVTVSNRRPSTESVSSDEWWPSWAALPAWVASNAAVSERREISRMLTTISSTDAAMLWQRRPVSATSSMIRTMRDVLSLVSMAAVTIPLRLLSISAQIVRSIASNSRARDDMRFSWSAFSRVRSLRRPRARPILPISSWRPVEGMSKSNL